MSRLHPRLLGLALIAGAGGSTLVHRMVHHTALGSPARLAELGLSLLTFMLASTGILLLIHGARLFERAKDGRRAAARASGIDPETTAAPGTPAGRAFDSRHRASMMQARHAIAAARAAAGRRTIAHARSTATPRFRPVPRG